MRAAKACPACSKAAGLTQPNGFREDRLREGTYSAWARENLWRTSEPRTQKMTSSAMLVAWSAERSRLRETMMALRAWLAELGLLLHDFDELGLDGAVHVVDLVVHGEDVFGERASASSRDWMAERIMTPTFSPMSGMSMGSSICGTFAERPGRAGRCWWPGRRCARGRR